MKTFYSPPTRNEEEFFANTLGIIDILINPNIREFTDDYNFCSFIQLQINIK